MKKLIILIMSNMLFANCLAFEESPLDPNSPLSALLNLQRLLGGSSNTQLQTTIRMDIKRSNGDSYNGNLLQFGRPNTGSNLRLIPHSKNMTSSANIVNGLVEVALIGLGIFEFRILDIDQNVIAVFQLNITQGLSDDNKDSLIPIIISGDLAISILSIRQELVQPNNRFISFFEGMGERGGRIYGLAFIESFENNTSTRTLAVLNSTDGLNFNTMYFPGDEFIFPQQSNETQPAIFNSSNVIQTGANSYFFILQNINSVDPGNPPTYGVELDSNNITNVYTISKRSSNENVQFIDSKKIVLFNNELLYAERNTNNGTLELRLDNNFLKTGSINNIVESPDFNAPNSFQTSEFMFEHKNGIVYNFNQLSNFSAYTNSNFSSGYNINFSSEPLIDSDKSVFVAGRNTIYYLEQSGTGPYTIRISNIESPVGIFTSSFETNIQFNATVSSQLPFNYFGRVLEFGNFHAMNLIEGNQYGMLVSDTSSQTVQVVDLASKIALGSNGFINTHNIMEIGNKLTIYRTVFIPGIPPKLIQNESTNGVDWTPNNNVQIQF